MDAPFIICGLGNPGDDYDGTRHNVGFEVVDRIAGRCGGRWTYPDPEYALSRARIRGTDALLVKPQTYMNLSGDALRLVRGEYGLEPGRLLVVCDDIALPLGLIRLRKKGSDGGQKGLRSIISTLGTGSFPRLRLGVDPPADGMDASDWVLGRFSADEQSTAEKMIAEAFRCVEVWIEDGIDTAMNRFNRRLEPPPDAPESD